MGCWRERERERQRGGKRRCATESALGPSGWNVSYCRVSHCRASHCVERRTVECRTVEPTADQLLLVEGNMLSARQPASALLDRLDFGYYFLGGAWRNSAKMRGAFFARLLELSALRLLQPHSTAQVPEMCAAALASRPPPLIGAPIRPSPRRSPSLDTIRLPSRLGIGLPLLPLPLLVAGKQGISHAQTL